MSKNARKLMAATILILIILSIMPVNLLGDTKEVTYEDLKGKVCGVMEGTIQDTVAKGIVEDPEFAYFTTSSDECVALAKNKIDYVLVVAEIFSSFQDQYPTLSLVNNLSVPCGDTAFILAKGYEEMNNELNQYITEIKNNGELQKLRDYWFSSEIKEAVEIPATGEKGILTIASSCAIQPFDYIIDGKYSGLEAAILAGFGEKYGYGFRVETMNFISIISAIDTGKCQIAANSIFITEERKKTLTFSESTSSPSFTILMRKDDISKITGEVFEDTESLGFIEGIKESLYKTFVSEQRWKMIVNGLGITLLINVASSVFGLILGYIFYLIMTGKNKVLKFILKYFKCFMTDSPIVVLLMIFYYVIFGKSNISAIWVAIITFGLIFSSTMSELYYSTINGIDKGQMEAAVALGFKPKVGLWKFIIPQALITFIPLLKAELIDLLKASSVVGYIAITELTKAGDLIRSWTFEPFFPLIVIAIIYLLLAWIIRFSLGLVEKYLDKHRRRERMEKKAGLRNEAAK